MRYNTSSGMHSLNQQEHVCDVYMLLFPQFVEPICYGSVLRQPPTITDDWHTPDFYSSFPELASRTALIFLSSEATDDPPSTHERLTVSYVFPPFG